MAALDFPASPSSGQRYSANGSTWEWNGSAWIKLATSSGPTDQVTTANDISTAALYPVMVDGAGDNKALKVSTSKLKFDASAGGLTVISGVGTVTAGIGSTALIVDGDARVLGILTVGSGTVKIDGAGITASGIVTSTEGVTISSDSKHLKIGAHSEGDLLAYHDGNKSVIVNYTGDFHLRTNNGSRSSREGIILKPNGSSEIYYSGSKKIETTNVGAVVTGILTATDFSGTGGGAADFPNGLTGTTGNFTSDVTIGGVLTYEDVRNIDSVGIVTARAGIRVTGGKIGIGTDNPSGSLGVWDASGSDPTMSLHHSNADVEGEIIRVARTDLNTIRYHSINAMHGGAATNNYINFALHNGTSTSSQTEVMRIRGDGRVAIGTDSPDTFLHVENGESTANTYIHVQNSHGGGGNAGVKIQNANGEWTLIANNVFRIIDDDNSQDALQIQPGATSSSNRCLRLFGSGGTGGSFATGSVAGDFEIKITNLQTVNGNNWRPAQLWVIWRGMNGNATSNNRSLTYVRIGGLSTWSWSAYDTIEGSDLSPAIDTSDDTTTSCNIDFTGPSDTGTVWVWCSCYNAAPTVEIIG